MPKKESWHALSLAPPDIRPPNRHPDKLGSKTSQESIAKLAQGAACGAGFGREPARQSPKPHFAL